VLASSETASTYSFLFLFHFKVLIISPNSLMETACLIANCHPHPHPIRQYLLCCDGILLQNQLSILSPIFSFISPIPLQACKNFLFASTPDICIRACQNSAYHEHRAAKTILEGLNPDECNELNLPAPWQSPLPLACTG
jgi:hypothetical protein